MSALAAVLPPLGAADAFLGLGSNVGERLTFLQQAVDLLDADRAVDVEAVSSVYETEPVGGPAQERYLNLALRVRTRRSPVRLLRVCKAVERTLGREPTVRWGPRRIDVDILAYDERAVRTAALEIPHPRLVERAFALIPLLEVAPGLVLPGGTSLAGALARLVPIEGVVMVGSQVRVHDGAR